jgi:hypothetical protein
MESNLHFPARLYQIIEVESSDIIRWEIDGRSFRIVNHARFETEVLPKYFRHGRVSSIQRQLNLYGFRCTHRGEEKGVFCHPEFVRGEYVAARQIRRKVPPAVKQSRKPPAIHKRKLSEDSDDLSYEPEVKRKLSISSDSSDPVSSEDHGDAVTDEDEGDDALFLSACHDIAKDDFFTETLFSSLAESTVPGTDDMDSWFNSVDVMLL